LNDSDDDKEEGTSTLFPSNSKRSKLTSSPSDLLPSSFSSNSSSSSTNNPNTSSKLLDNEKNRIEGNGFSGLSSEGKTSSSSATGISNRRPVATVLIDTDEWITIDKQMKGIELGTVGIKKEGKKEQGNGGEIAVEGEEEEFKRGETIVVVKSLLDENNMNTSNSLSSRSSSTSKANAGVDSSGNGNGVKNVKKFMKNSVRKVDSMERVSLKTVGEKVLPVQSEREVQVYYLRVLLIQIY
jgi:hypothetical protein